MPGPLNTVLLPLLLSAALAGPDSAGVEYRGVEGSLRVQAPRVQASITVDGVLDEPIWQQAARLTGFSQYSPVDGRPAVHETEVLVWYSSTAIHFGIRAHAPRGSVVASLADRDKLQDEDRVEILLGTFNDGRQALMFGVNPYGVQMDGVMAEGSRGRGGSSGGGGMFGGGGGGRDHADQSPDFVFDSKGRLTDYGYEVELRIPFKTLRFQTAERQDWGLHVVRNIQATGHEESWVPARRASSSFLPQGGRLEGLHGLSRGLVMDLNPAITATSAGRLEDDEWVEYRNFHVGGNVRWGVTPNLTLNGTANPDFSQVESDATQVVSDPRRAQFFPEKRPFFLDGAELFNTPNSLIYTRRIVAPVGAAKLTGTAGGTNIGVLLGVDDPEVSRGGEDHPVISVARIQRDLGEKSRIGLVYTDRRERDYSNQVAGVDTRLVLGDIWTVNAQLSGSRTFEDGVRTDAPTWQASLSRTGRSLGLSYSFSGVSDEFVAGAGFISQRGIVSGSASHSLTWYGLRGALVERSSVNLWLRGVWDYDDFVAGTGIRDKQLFLSGSANLRGGWRGSLLLNLESFGYDDRLYEDVVVERRMGGAVVDTVAFTGGHETISNQNLRLEVNSPRLGPLGFRTEVTVGNDVNYDEWSPARIVFAGLSADVRPTDQIRLDGSYNLQHFRRRSDGSTVRAVHVPRLRLEYQLSRAIFLRAVTEYSSTVRDSLRDDGRTEGRLLFYDDDSGLYQRDDALTRSDNRFRTEFLFSFQPVPGTVFFAGYNSAVTETDRFRFRNLSRSYSGFFLKASYLFRL